MVLEGLFLSILSMSISVGIILAGLLISAPWFRGHTAPFQSYILWVLLALRLLLPVPAFFPADAQITISNAPLSYKEEFPDEQDAEPAAAEALTPFSEPQRDVGYWRGISPLAFLSFAWLLGTAVFVAYQGIGYWHLRCRLLRWNTVPSAPEPAQLVKQISAELRIKRAPLLMINPQAESPLVLDFFRPVLILPTAAYPEEQLRFILRHELTHMKRCDILLKFLLITANALHWYNPLLYWMRREAAADMELACDDCVLAGCPIEARRAYSETILASIKNLKKLDQPLTSQFYGGMRTMKRRIMHILTPEKPRHSALLVAVVMISTLFLGSLIACTVYTPPQWVDGKLDMGSLFDHILIDHKSVRVRGLSQDMTPQDIMDYYGLKETDCKIIESQPQGDEKGSFYYLFENAFFDETKAVPCTVQFQFNEEKDQLLRFCVSIRYPGMPWEDAHKSAMTLFEEINERGGKAITDKEWMQNYDYKGMVYNDFGDSLEALSEVDTHFTRQYMYAGSKHNDAFAVSMSYQDVSHTDTTEALGQNVDDLFGISINIPIKHD